MKIADVGNGETFESGWQVRDWYLEFTHLKVILRSLAVHAHGNCRGGSSTDAE
jgi:hypothetical protein